jgi:CheY-like chemotaxis protein
MPYRVFGPVVPTLLVMENELVNKIILLVDDCEGDALLLSQAFTQVGLRNPIIWLSSAQKAIAYLSGEGEYGNRERSPLPSILILDLKMPQMDGFAVLEFLRRRPELKNLFVVVLSGLDDTKNVQRAYALGANSYLSKPVNPFDLANMVQFFRGYWMISEPCSKVQNADRNAKR